MRKKPPRVVARSPHDPRGKRDGGENETQLVFHDDGAAGSADFFGRPGGRSVRVRPSGAALWLCQAVDPVGARRSRCGLFVVFGVCPAGGGSRATAATVVG